MEEGRGMSEEFTLTFEQALRAMLKGKVVYRDPKHCRDIPTRMKFDKGRFMSKSIINENWSTTAISVLDQYSAWKVDE